MERPIADAAARGPVPLSFDRVHRLGRGAAYGVTSAELHALRARLAKAFADRLTPQDRQPFHPHATVQNKAQPDVARATLDALSASFAPWAGTGVGLLLWRYLGGPWRLEREFPFLDGSAQPPDSKVAQAGPPA